MKQNNERTVYARTLDMSNVDGLMQEKRNFIANTLQLRLSCTNRSMCQVKGTHSIEAGRYRGLTTC